MNTPAAPHAPLLRRYTAWSLDAAAIGVLVLAVLHRHLCEAWRTCDRAVEALTQVMAASMQQMVDQAAPPLVALQGSIHDPALQVAVTALVMAVSALVLPAMAVFGLLALLWFGIFEGSRWQATPGKRVLDLQVVDDDGARPGFVRAVLRNAAGLLSWLSVNLGHLLAARAPRHQALHDRIAGTRVVHTGTAPMPLAARLWLWLQPAACFGLLALLMRYLDQRVASALAQTLGV